MFRFSPAPVARLARRPPRHTNDACCIRCEKRFQFDEPQRQLAVRLRLRGARGLVRRRVESVGSVGLAPLLDGGRPGGSGFGAEPQLERTDVVGGRRWAQRRSLQHRLVHFNGAVERRSAPFASQPARSAHRCHQLAG